MTRIRIARLGMLSAVALSLMMIQGADAGGRFGDRGKHRRGDMDAAQTQRPGQEHRARMIEALGLSEEQQTQLDALHLAHRTEMENLRAGEQIDREAAQALRQQHREQMEAILTPQQLETLKQLRADRPQRPQGRRGRGGEGSARGALFDEALNLSEGQKTAIQQLRESLRGEMQDLRASGEGSREAAGALFEQHREQINALLSDEQRATLAQLHTERQADRQADGDRPRHGRRRRQQPADEDGAAEAAAKSAVDVGSWGLLKKSID